MVSELDIWRTAKLLVDQHGDDAPLEAAMRADRMFHHGDLDGQAIWRKVKGATEELLKTEADEGEARH